MDIHVGDWVHGQWLDETFEMAKVVGVKLDDEKLTADVLRFNFRPIEKVLQPFCSGMFQFVSVCAGDPNDSTAWTKWAVSVDLLRCDLTDLHPVTEAPTS